MKSEELKDPLTVAEAARIAGVTPMAIYNAIQRKKIPAIRKGKIGLFIWAKDLYAYLITKRKYVKA